MSTTPPTRRASEQTQDAVRLAALRRYGLSGSGAAPDFDDVVRLAASVTSRPYAAVTVADRDGDFLIVAAVGARSGIRNEREGVPCSLVIERERAIVLDDLDACPPEQVSVATDAGLRSYVGVPLRTPEGVVVGALCVADCVARENDPAMVATLESLARLLLSALAARAAVADLAAQTERLSQDARTDPLTGLLNRRSLQPMLDDLAEGSCLALVDLDHFKALNDTHGHAAGDQALRTLASVLRENSREQDLVARWGGEEFVVLFPLSTPTEAVAAMDRIRQAWASVGLTTLSAGVAWRGFEESAEDVVARADVALYAAKARGRDRVLMYEADMVSAETGSPRH